MGKKTFQYDLSLESLLVMYQVHYIEAVKITLEGTRMNHQTCIDFPLRHQQK